MIHQNKKYDLKIATRTDAPEIRHLVNTAYKELGDRGLNYSAVDQDETQTWERMKKGRCFTLSLEGKIVATILLYKENQFTNKNTAYLGQFAVTPELKKNGIGTLLMDHCEKLAHQEGYEGIQLDTAIPATHLVEWYQARGYKIVGTIHWDGKTYDSYIFELLF